MPVVLLRQGSNTNKQTSINPSLNQLSLNQLKMTTVVEEIEKNQNDEAGSIEDPVEDLTRLTPIQNKLVDFLSLTAVFPHQYF